MNITFKKIEFKNFFSFGNTPTKINLDENKIILVTGENFAGKSSAILDTITFALFGRAFRPITKSKLVNAYNKKDCEVKLTFVKNEITYQIIRGIKPNKFELYNNGIKNNELSSLKDEQFEFEDKILNLNFKTFQQIVILGSASYTPFMRLKTAERREIVEDLLNLKVLSLMNLNLKERNSESKSVLNDLKYELKSITLEMDSKKSEIRYIESLIEKQKASNDNEIRELNLEIEKLESEIESLEVQIDEVSNKLSIKKCSEEEIKKLESLKQQIIFSLKQLVSENLFFKENSTCSKCKQPINLVFKENQMNDFKNKIEKKQHGLIEIEGIIKKKKENEKKVKENLFFVKLSREKINIKYKEIESIKKKIEKLNHKQGIDDSDIKKFAKKVLELEKKKKELEVKIEQNEKELEILKECGVLLKDKGGIKSKLVEKYLPIINDTMEFYLSSLGLKLYFKLNENFEEEILDFNGNSFNYFSLSEGEKLRVDLSMMFTWRKISKLRNKLNTNLLIMDEVMDGAADGNLQSALLDILHSKDMSIFVISHRSEALTEKFNKQISFKKENGYSQMIVEE